MDVLLILLLVVLNGVFAMSEMALASARKTRLQSAVAAGDERSRAALALMDRPNQFLSTIQIGITSIGVLNGIVGEAAFSDALASRLHALGLSVPVAGVLATALVVSLITVVTIVLGELVPKRVGQLYPEVVARIVAPPMTMVARAAGPLVALLAWATATILRLLKLRADSGPSVTEAEIAASLDEGVDAGVIEAHEHRMVHNVFNLDDRPLPSLMVPRADVVWLPADLSVTAALAHIGALGSDGAHSWYLVCDGDLDRVVGKVGVARLLSLGPQADGTLADYVLPAVFVPETLSALELLEQFRTKAGRLVCVVDEYGVVQGLVTPHDLMEAITGELQPVSADDAWATPRGDGSWLLDGAMPIAELKSRLSIDTLPDEDKGRYNTLAGLLMAVSGEIPATGARIASGDWVFEVVDLDGRRIDKVLATAL